MPQDECVMQLFGSGQRDANDRPIADNNFAGCDTSSQPQDELTFFLCIR